MEPPITVRQNRRSWRGWGFVAPFLALFLLVVIAPLIYAAYLSLTQDRLIGGSSFVGIDNYVAVFTDTKFWGALGRVVLFALIQVPFMLFVALFAALAIDSGSLPGSSLYRITMFLPYAVPGVVAALLWGYIYGPNFGLVGDLRGLGIPVPDLLGSGLILGSMANIGFWLYAGYNMLIYQAALKSIPGELYEAAQIDGAGPLRVVWSIKLPAIRSSIAVTSLFSFIGALQLFNEPSVMQSLAPNVITTSFTPNIYAFNLAFTGHQATYSAAIAITMGALTILGVLVVQRFTRRKVDE